MGVSGEGLSKAYDVVVVGGGPAGAMAAKTAQEHGARALLLEWHREVGLPVQCTGLLSVRGFEAAGASKNVILREMRGAYAYGPSGQCLQLESPRTQAYVIDRDRLDQDLVRQAAEAGVDVRVNARATALDTDSGTFRTLSFSDNGVERSVKAGVVIGSDGAKSDVARWAGLAPPRKRIIGVQVTIPYQLEREDYVEVHLGREVAPHFFAWAVPSFPGHARVGLGTDQGKQARSLLDRWLSERFAGREIVERNAGEIPIGPAERTVADGVMLVGDAAGQAKPTSGGGIYTGTSCGRIAGEVAARAVQSRDTSAERLSEYERRWREQFDDELRFGMMAHEILCRLSDEELNQLWATAQDPEILKVICEHGDIDYTSWVAKALLKRPRLWGKLLRAVPRKRELFNHILPYLK